MNEEIIEEVIEDSIDNSNEVVNDIDMDSSVEEAETTTTLDEDIVVDALLHVIETRQSELQTESGSEVTPEVTPIIDYTDILTSIDARLDNIETVVCVTPEAEHDLETPLNDLNFSEICLVGIIVCMLAAILIKFITKNSFHI